MNAPAIVPKLETKFQHNEIYINYRLEDSHQPTPAHEEKILITLIISRS